VAGNLSRVAPPGSDGGVGRRWIAALVLALVTLLLAATSAVGALRAGMDVLEFPGPLVVVVVVAVGGLVVRAQPRNPVGWLLIGAALAVALADTGAQAANAQLPGSRWMAWVGTWTRPVGVYVLLVLVPLHFPRGLPPGAAWAKLRLAVVAGLVCLAGWYAIRPGPVQLTGAENPLGLEVTASLLAALNVVATGFGVLMLMVGLAGLVHRYRRGTRTERSQVKWIAYAAGLWLALVLVSWPAAAIDPALGTLVELGLLLVGIGLPIAIGIAVLGHGRYDVDQLISRTMVYGTLTLAVITLYIVSVGYLGALLQARDSTLVSLLATGVVAVAFSPLRERLQRVANRLVYGERSDPYTALDRLGRRLDAAAPPQELLDLAAAELANALRVQYAAVESTSADGEVTVAEHGERPPAARLARSELHASGAHIGWLTVGPLVEGQQLPAADRALLESLSRPVGATLHARALAAELQRSRAALVAAREEERSRLHRELHDGLGPELATISMLAEVARDVTRADPARAEALLDGLVDRTLHAVSDLRLVVHALRPPALEALGLLGALRSYAATHTERGLHVTVDASGGGSPLAAEVEVALYRIAVEAITNVTRHARAQTCVVRLSIEDDGVALDVYDDGRGLASDHVPGVGLTSMRIRAAELDGHCVVTAGPDGGTHVNARLPGTTRDAVDALTVAPGT
jgi:signal transduction histidine kinase